MNTGSESRQVRRRHVAPSAPGDRGHPSHGGSMRVRVVDHTGNVMRNVRVPRGMPASAVKQQLVDRLQFGSSDITGGGAVQWDLTHNGAVIPDNSSLATAGVIDDAELEISPRIVSAGRRL